MNAMPLNLDDNAFVDSSNGVMISFSDMDMRAVDVIDAIDAALDGRTGNGTAGKSGNVIAHTDHTDDQDGYLVQMPFGGMVEGSPLVPLCEIRSFAQSAVEEFGDDE
jgi:hypothetical protein